MSLKSETFEKFLLFKKKLEMAQSQRHLRSGIKKDFGEFGEEYTNLALANFEQIKEFNQSLKYFVNYDLQNLYNVDELLKMVKIPLLIPCTKKKPRKTICNSYLYLQYFNRKNLI